MVLRLGTFCSRYDPAKVCGLAIARGFSGGFVAQNRHALIGCGPIFFEHGGAVFSYPVSCFGAVQLCRRTRSGQPLCGALGAAWCSLGGDKVGHVPMALFSGIGQSCRRLQTRLDRT